MEALLEKLHADPALADVPRETSADQLQLLLARERGQLLTLTLELLDQSCIAVCVPVDCTVRRLKLVTQAALAAKSLKRGVSWKSVWKKWCLCGNGTPLKDLLRTLEDYGLSSGSRLTFHSLVRDHRREKQERKQQQRRRKQRQDRRE